MCIRVSAVYLPKEGMWFDEEYYRRQHVALAAKEFAGKIKATRVDMVWRTKDFLTGNRDVSPCTLDIYFETREDAERFRQFVLGPESDTLKADIPNYTNCDVMWTIAEVEGAPG